MRKAGIYIHIPFCKARCAYCDFLSTTSGTDVQKEYFSALRRDIEGCGERAGKSGLPGPDSYSVVSVFFGGGTPSLPDPLLLTGILDSVRSCFHLEPDAEITVECNPGTLDDRRLSAYLQAGVNRLSIGLQSADDGMLKKLGRIHDFETYAREFEAARKTGFSNISVDLMYGLPGQDRASFRETLERVLSLDDPPQHISPYSLIVEEGTPFWERYHEDAERKSLGDAPLFLPSEDEEAGMLSDLKQILIKRGFHRYEISNWTLPGFESVHNKGYWERREYLGFGLGASGQAGRIRYKKTSSLPAYLNGDYEGKGRTILTDKDIMEETMFLGLREMCGVTRSHFQESCHAAMDQVYGDVIRRLAGLGLLSDDGRAIRLTERGIDISNLVLSEFLLD